jgi:hypothetical protein
MVVQVWRSIGEVGPPPMMIDLDYLSIGDHLIMIVEEDMAIITLTWVLFFALLI